MTGTGATQADDAALLAPVRAAVSDALAVDPSGLDSPAVLAQLRELTAAQNQLTALQHRLLAEAEQRRLAGDYAKPRTTAELLQNLVPITHKTARDTVELACALSPRRSLTGDPVPALAPATAAACAEGTVSAEQATVIVDTVQRARAKTDPDVAAIIEKALLDTCHQDHPARLRRTADQLLLVLDSYTDLTDDDPNAAPHRQPRRGLRRRVLPDGTIRYTLDLPALDAALLDTVIDALTDPTRARSTDTHHDTGKDADGTTVNGTSGSGTSGSGASGGGEQAGAGGTGGTGGAASTNNPIDSRAGAQIADPDIADGEVADAAPEVEVPDPRSAAERRADAVIEVFQRLLRSGTLPNAGGATLTVLVTTTLTDLHTHTGTARTERGDPIPVPDLLAAATGSHTGWIPIVLDDHGAVLHHGREQRTATTPQRRAAAVRDAGCSMPGCDRPPAWTQLHHVCEWEAGGRTDIDTLAAVCAPHHRAIHHAGWSIAMPDGIPEWTPPPWIDPTQTPIRNLTPQHTDTAFRAALNDLVDQRLRQRRADPAAAADGCDPPGDTGVGNATG